MMRCVIARVSLIGEANVSVADRLCVEETEVMVILCISSGQKNSLLTGDAGSRLIL